MRSLKCVALLMVAAALLVATESTACAAQEDAIAATRPVAQHAITKANALPAETDQISQPWWFNAAMPMLGVVIGGAITFLTQWFITAMSGRSAAKAQMVTLLIDQLKYLYGPLQFLVSLNQACFDQNDKIIEAGRENYSGVDPGRNPNAQERQSEEIDRVIGMANEYVALVMDNNANVFELLRGNYSYIDPDDMQVFNEFTAHYIHIQTEYKPGNSPSLPYGVRVKLETPSYMRPEFIKRVNDKFTQKQELLTYLTHGKAARPSFGPADRTGSAQVDTARR